VYVFFVLKTELILQLQSPRDKTFPFKLLKIHVSSLSFMGLLLFLLTIIYEGLKYLYFILTILSYRREKMEGHQSVHYAIYA